MNLGTSTRSEFTKVFSTAGWWILAVVLVVYVGGLASIVALAFGTLADGGTNGPPVDTGDLPLTIYSIATSVGYVFALLIGTLMSTAEFRHQTLTPTFLATPRRGVALGAKVLAAVVVGLLFGVIAIVATVGPAAGLLAANGIDPLLAESATWAMLGRALIAFVLWTIVGVGVGAAVRSQAVAIVIVLAFTQFVEPALRIGGAFFDWLGAITAYLPGAASDALVGVSFYAGLGGASAGTAEQLAPWAGGLVLAAYAVALLVLASLTSWRRDIT